MTNKTLEEQIAGLEAKAEKEIFLATDDFERGLDHGDRRTAFKALSNNRAAKRAEQEAYKCY